MFDLGSVSTPWRDIFTASMTVGIVCTSTVLIVNGSSSFRVKRIQDVGAPTSDTDAATKKYVDDTNVNTRSYVDIMESATMTYVDAHDHATRNSNDNAIAELLAQIDVLSTQAGQIVTFLVAEMSEEEIPFIVIYNEDDNSKTLTVGQERALNFTLPASLQEHTDLITEVKLTFSCRKTDGVRFFKGRSTTSLGFDLTGTALTVTESFPAFALSTSPLKEILNVKVTLRVTVASKVFTVASTTVKVRDRLAQNFTMSM
jgi:hypothetical protein